MNLQFVMGFTGLYLLGHYLDEVEIKRNQAIIPDLTVREYGNGWSPYGRRDSAVVAVSKMLYGNVYFKIFFSFLLSALGS